VNAIESSPESELSAADSMTSTSPMGLTSLQIENILGKFLKNIAIPYHRENSDRPNCIAYFS
jgi:hypothetical protein